MNDVKSLIMCHLEGHWIPFTDVDTCKNYLLRMKTEFNLDISKVRIFFSTFKEIDINNDNHE